MRSVSTNSLLGLLVDAKRVAVVAEVVVTTPGGSVETLTFTSVRSDQLDPAWPTGTVIAGALARADVAGQRLDPTRYATTIGGLTLDLVDLEASVIAAFAQQNALGRELSKGFVTLYVGYDFLERGSFDPNDFDAWAVQRVAAIQVDGSRVTLQTQDVQRQVRKTIFARAKTRLFSTLSATATTIECESLLDDFGSTVHGPWYEDRPNFATVGYVKIGEEIIRWEAKGTPALGRQTFTTCTRGVFGTRAQAHEVRPDQEPPVVEEFVYLEGSAVSVARALLTGAADSAETYTIPDSWHAGLDASDLASEWGSIGADIWSETDPAVGPQVRVWGVDATDAKGFVERELFPIAGVFAPVLGDGKLGLRRLTSVVFDAPSVLALTDSDLIRTGPLRYLPKNVRNRYRIEWSVDASGEIRRVNEFIDSDSVARYGERPLVIARLPALHGSSSTRASLVAVKNSLRERLAEAPMQLEVTATKRAMLLEVGDVVRVSSSLIRDPLASSGGSEIPTLDRSFEVESVALDLIRQRARLDLATVSRRPGPISDCAEDAALSDGFYNATGTDLDSLAGVSGGVVTSDLTLTGGTDLSSSVWYHLGDLEVADGVTVTIEDNVQLRIRGTLTVNGAINGVGTGLDAPTDTGPDNTFNPAPLNRPAQAFLPGPTATAGFLGRVQGGAGLAVNNSGVFFGSSREVTVPAPIGGSSRTGVPEFRLVNNGTTLEGVPTDLRGSSGAPGGREFNDELDGTTPGYRQFIGGAGGAGGAGLLIVTRGMVVGLEGMIDLSGSAGLAGPRAATGGGAGGAPGALVVLLDGDLAVVPTFTAQNFVAAQGTNADNRPIPEQDLSATAFRVQFIPCNETTTPDPSPFPVPFFLEEVLDGQPSPPPGGAIYEATHVTVSGNIDVEIAYSHKGPAPATAEQADVELDVERKSSADPASSYALVGAFNETSPGYSRTIAAGGAQVDALSVRVRSRGLAPGSYDFRLTARYFETVDPAPREEATHESATLVAESFER